MNSNSTCDVLIIGAGPAGIISAGILNKKGYRVLVIEKTKFPRFVIGESLLPRCMEHIQEAGLMEAVEQAGFQKKFGAIFYKNNNTCDFNFSDQYTEGWKWTWQVPRADFDKTLADTVQANGAEIIYETSVDKVEITDDEVITSISDAKGNKTIRSQYIIDGSGYGRVLPRLFGLDKPSSFPARTALFAHIHEPERPLGPESNRITATSVNNDLWIWNIPFSNGITSVGFVGDLSYFESHNSETSEEKFRSLLEKDPRTKARFQDKKLVFEPRTITGYSIGVTQLYGKRYVLTGNSTEFLDPIFSSGVTFAMESGSLAAKLIDKEIKGEKVDWEKEYTSYIKQGVEVFRSYVSGWYDGTLQNIFFAENIKPEFKNQICSVLAGYVWDTTNPFVKKHNSILKTLNTIITQNL